MNRIKNFFYELASSTIVDALKIVTVPLLVAAFTFLTSQSTLSYFKFSGLSFWVLVAIITLTATYISIYVYEYIKGNRPKFAPVDTNFIMTSVEIEFKYVKIDNFEYKKKKNLVAIKDNIRSFHDRFHWTGDSNYEILTENNSHRFIDRGKRSVWRCYEIDFQRSLKRGEEETASVVWKLSDQDGEFVPFISSAIDHPTQHLTLKLDASEVADNVSRVYIEESPLLGAEAPYNTHEVEGRDGVYVYSLENPKLMHHYEMRWIVNQ